MQVLPQLCRDMVQPLAIVEDELFDVVLTCKPPQHEVMEHHIVQDDNAGNPQGRFVDTSVELVISDLVKAGVKRLEFGEIG